MKNFWVVINNFSDDSFATSLLHDIADHSENTVDLQASEETAKYDNSQKENKCVWLVETKCMCMVETKALINTVSSHLEELRIRPSEETKVYVPKCS